MSAEAHTQKKRKLDAAMSVTVSSTKVLNGQIAAHYGAVLVNQAIAERGHANVILATGASQFEMLQALVKAAVDWSKVTCFHLDEYVGLDSTHKASFQGYLQQRFVDQLTVKPKAFHFVKGLDDPAVECQRLGELIRKFEIDVAFIGIGENGHLAFNDPPCDLETKEPFLVVDLDEACRKQQFGEGWFPSLDAVPKKAISMSMSHILQSKHIVCTVPDERKAAAVKACLSAPIDPQTPCASLRAHPSCVLFLDEAAASQL